MDDNDFLDILSDKVVLYAEDEPGIRRTITETLELFFMEVVAVADGQAVLDEMTLKHYDALILDISMPHIDGLEAVREIRKSDQQTPIIIVSAHSTQEYLWRAVELKISKYLTKPHTKENLTAALKQVALELTRHKKEPIALGNACFYSPCKKKVFNAEKSIPLTPTESRLLEYLIGRENCAVSFEEIHDYLWGYEPHSKEAIKSLVKDLRKKVGTERIQSLYGIGYLFAPQSASE